MRSRGNAVSKLSRYRLSNPGRRDSDVRWRTIRCRNQQLIATLADELRNPLAPLRTGVELLRKVREQPQLLDTLPSMMERQIRQLVELIDRLLDVFQEESSG